MSNTKNSYGKPVFGDGFSLPGDLQDLADFTDLFAWLRGGTSTDRTNLVAGQIRAGMLFTESNTGYVYWYPAGGGAPQVIAGPTPYVVARSTTQQSLANSTWATLTTWATPTTQREITFDVTTGLATIIRSGVYELDGYVSINAGGSVGDRVSRFTRNGTADANTVVYNITSTNGNVTLPVRRTISLLAGDVIRFQALQASGGALNTIVSGDTNGYETRQSIRFIAES